MSALFRHIFVSIPELSVLILFQFEALESLHIQTVQVYQNEDSERKNSNVVTKFSKVLIN